LLETRMEITAYNLHDGSFRPSLGPSQKLKSTGHSWEPSLLWNQTE
jgi:hypothetical protein